MAQNPNQPNLNQTRQDIMDIASMTEETFRSVAANIQDMFANALNASDTVIKSFQKDISNSIKSAARESSKLADNFEKMNQGALKQADIQKQLETRAAKLRSIEVSINALKKVGTAEAIYQANELTRQYQDLVGINQSYTDELNKQIELLDEIDRDLNRQLGLTPQILGGLDKSLKKLGLPDLGFSKALEDTRKIAIQNKQNGQSTNIWSTYTKQLGSNLKEVLSFSNLIQVGIGFIIDAFLTLDNLTGSTAKNLGISYNQASQLNSEFVSIARENNNIFVTTKGLNESFNQINQALGTNGRLSEELLVTQTELVKQVGYSVEAATMLSKLSLATGKPTKEITTQFLGQVKALNLVNNTAINEKQLLESISKVSKATLATFASQPGKLAEAAYEAKRLGLELSQIEAIQSSLLDIESSIAAEFEAEVITGKQLNLEAARYYALTNDLAGVAKELSAQGITQVKFAGMTVIEQEAIAKAMGMSRDQMAGMLMEQEAISKLSNIDGKNAKEKYENAVKQYGVEKANAMLGDEILAQQMQSASIQERLVQTVEKLKEAFVSIAEPLMAIISPIVDILSPVLSGISQIVGYIVEGFKTLLPVLVPIAGILAVMYARTIGLAIASAAKSAFQALGGIPIVGPALALAAIGYAASKIKQESKPTSVGDLSSPASGKTQVSTREGGLFELSKNDDLVAAPGLINKLNTPSSPIIVNQPTTPQTPIIDYDKMALAMSRVQVQTNLDGVRVSSELQKAPLGIATRKI
jgi:hypothetical protein